MQCERISAIVLFLCLGIMRGADAQSTDPAAADTPPGAVLVVDAPGVIEVSSLSMAEGLQRSESEVVDLIRSGGLELELGGESIAWQPIGEGMAIRFVAPELRSPFSKYQRFFLSVANGVTMEERALVPHAPIEPHTFLSTRRFEENIFPGPTGAPNPRKDLFFWYALSSEAQAVIPVSLPFMVGSSARELRVYVHGATDHPGQPHRVELIWNGQSVGVFDLMGRRRHEIVVSMEGVAAAVDNVLIVQQHVAGPAPPVLYVDAVEVDYTRQAVADAPVFEFGGADDGVHSIDGLEAGTADIYDVTDPRTPQHYGGVAIGPAGRLSFSAEGSNLRFLVATPGGISSPIEVSHRPATTLRSPSHDVDYVIIAASNLLADARALADLREADGYRVLLVDIDDVYRSFANGERDPLAVREFLAFAWTEWQTAPRFAVLVGKGSLDYRDLMGFGANALPPALAVTDGGLFPSDSILGDVVGDDGVPEIAIGRLPITMGAELRRIIDNIVSFEANHESRDVLFASDDSEYDEFASAARLISEWVPPERVREIALNTDTVEGARDRLYSMWGELSWMTYIGHGAIDRLADEGLLTLADVPALAQLASSPVLVGWTCNIVRFDIPGFASIGEELLIQGASAGVFSATGWSNHLETDFLRSEFTEAVFASEVETIGEAMIRAHQHATDASLAQHRVYLLMGDPALRLRPAQAPPVSRLNAEPDSASPTPATEGTATSMKPPADDQELGVPATGCEIAFPGSGHSLPGFAFIALGAIFLARRRRSAGMQGARRIH